MRSQSAGLGSVVRAAMTAALLLAALAGSAAASVADRIPYPGLDGISLPDGFRIELYAGDVPGARSLCLGDSGTVFVGTRGVGAVYALSDTDSEPGADRVYVLAENLNMPNGVAFRDGMGDDVPPDELNRITERGQHFGFPYLHGSDLRDPEFGDLAGPRDIRLPRMELGPHVAALGMRFYTGEMFPERCRGQIFIAEHGSWNRSAPIGYRVMLVRLEGGQAVSYEVFAEGWLTGEGAFGRPVDVQVMPDGALLVSDDRAGRIYRIACGM